MNLQDVVNETLAKLDQWSGLAERFFEAPRPSVDMPSAKIARHCESTN